MIGTPFKKGHKPWNSGIKSWVKPWLGKHHSDETKDKLSKQRIGKHYSKNTEFKKGSFIPHKTGCKCFRCTPSLWKKINIGRVVSDITKKKLSDIKKGKIPKNILRGDFKGNKNCNWCGGKSFEKYGREFNKKLKELIRERDNRKCFICSKKEENIKLSVHHIDYNKKNNNPKNLISLCIVCHTKTNKKRKYWTEFFINNII